MPLVLNDHVDIVGTLTIGENTFLAGQLAVSGTTTLSDIIVAGTLTLDNTIIADDAANSNTDGTGGMGQVLTSNGTGRVYWADVDALPTMTDAQILVGSTGNEPTSLTISGDISMDVSGVTTISDRSVSPIKLTKGTADHFLSTDASGFPQWEDKSSLSTFTDLTVTNAIQNDGAGGSSPLYLDDDVSVGGELSVMGATQFAGMILGKTAVQFDGTSHEINVSEHSLLVLTSGSGVDVTITSASAGEVEGATLYIVNTDGTKSATVFGETIGPDESGMLVLVDSSWYRLF